MKAASCGHRSEDAAEGFLRSCSDFDGCALQGLGDLYAADYVQAATGVGAEDKQEPIRKEARMLLKSLFARLDALSHFHYAPKPIIEDMRVRAEVPALAMEDVAPQVCYQIGFSIFSIRDRQQAFKPFDVHQGSGLAVSCCALVRIQVP